MSSVLNGEYIVPDITYNPAGNLPVLRVEVGTLDRRPDNDLKIHLQGDPPYAIIYVSVRRSHCIWGHSDLRSNASGLSLSRFCTEEELTTRLMASFVQPSSATTSPFVFVVSMGCDLLDPSPKRQQMISVWLRRASYHVCTLI